MHRELADFAERIARGAGAILLKGFRSAETVVSYKSRTNLVTNRDNASEEFLYTSISKQFRDHSIIAEEGSEREAEGEYLWYVDPLDGTNNYAHGIAMFCVSIGVYSRTEHEVVLGVVYDPFHDELFSAVRGFGSFMNGKKIAASHSEDIGYSILATGFPYDKDVNEQNNLREFARIVPRIQGIRRTGSAALDLSYVACGRFDGYWEFGIKPWDIAGGAIIVTEAGGRVTDFDGGLFALQGGRIVASNGLIHKAMLQLLAGGEQA